MRCPRCDAELTLFTLASGDGRTRSCTACGFADIPASQQKGTLSRESWDTVLDRCSTRWRSQRAKQTEGRTESVSLPDTDNNDDELPGEGSMEGATVTTARTVRAFEPTTESGAEPVERSEEAAAEEDDEVINR